VVLAVVAVVGFAAVLATFALVVAPRLVPSSRNEAML